MQNIGSFLYFYTPPRNCTVKSTLLSKFVKLPVKSMAVDLWSISTNNQTIGILKWKQVIHKNDMSNHIKSSQNMSNMIKIILKNFKLLRSPQQQ